MIALEPSRETERALLARAASGDRAARDSLLMSLHPLAQRMGRLAAFERLGHTADDLAQVAMLGALQAVERFDASVDVRLATYAARRMKGAIVDFLRDHGGLVRFPRLAQLSGESPIFPTPFPRRVDDNGEACELEPLARDGGETAVDDADELDRLLSLLSTAGRRSQRGTLSRDRKILLDYFGGVTQEAISRRLGVNATRVCQIIKRRMVQLRAIAAQRRELQAS